jgi:predicted phage tail protein
VQTKAKRKPREKTVRHLNVRRVVNPFEPLRSVETEQWVWKKRKSLAAYLPAGLADDYVVSCNGAVIEPEDLANTFPQADDFIVLCPIPRGGGGDGGGGKIIFRMIAMVVIAVAAAYTGGAAAGAMGFAEGTAGFAAASAAVATAVTVAGSMLLNAILPPATATNTGGSLNNSASYGADGAKNTSNEGVPYPVSYGKFRMAGNIIGLYTELNTSGSDASGKGNNQILYMLVNAGEGPIASISDVLINGRAAEDFQELTLQQRLGYGAQAPIDWFSKIMSPVNHNVMLPANGDFVTFTTVEECEQFRIDFACPLGLYSVDTTTGKINNNTVAIEADYRQVGSPNWIGLGPTSTLYQEVDIVPVFPGTPGAFDFDPTLIISGIDIHFAGGALNVPAAALAEAHSKYDQFIGKPIGAWPVALGGIARIAINTTTTTGNITITDNLRATVRRSFTSPQVPLARYEIRVRRNTDYTITTVNNFTNVVRSEFPTDNSDTAQSDTYVTDINEIKFDGVAYNNTALLALRVQMDSQLSGVPNVTFMHGGKLVTVIGRVDGQLVSSQVPSTNPAWVWYDMTTNSVYGAGIDPSRIDLDSVIAWANYCDTAGLVWNGPLDQVMTFWDAAALVMRVGHAQVMQLGTRYYVTTEAPSDPVMMFGMGNIVKDSFKMTWLGMKDRATEVDVTYFDETDYNKAKTVKVQDSTLALTAAQQNVSAITMYGVTDIKTAYKEGAFALNLNRYLTQSVEFDAPIEAIACTPGDVVLVQHDMPDWAYSGRLEAGSTTTALALDKPVTMEAGKVYKALLLTDTVTRFSGRIQNVINNFVQIAGGASVSGRVLRIRSGSGAEAAITTIVSDGVYVDDVSGFTAGDTVTLIDTDVVTEVSIVNQPGETETIHAQTPLNYTPTQFTNYIFGESANVRRPYRVKSITLASSSLNRTISALEYNEAVYDLSAYDGVLGTLTPPLLDPSQAAIGEVQELSVYEESYVNGTNILNVVRASWALPIVGSYAGADIYVQINGGAFNKVATVPSAPTYVVTGATTGDLVAVKVVAYDLWNKRASYENAPVANHKIIGSAGSLQVAAVTGANFIWSGRDCKIFWNYNSVTGSYEFGSEPDGADSGARDPHFLDYEITVYDQNGHLLRTEHTTDNSYDYTYEKNFADGLHRRLTFHICARDIFNNKGKPCVIDAYNPPPQVVSITNTAAFDRVQINFQTTGDPDYAGAEIFLAWSGDVDPHVSMDPAKLAYDGPDTSVLLTNLMFNSDYQFMIAPYDAFGKSELIPSAVFTFHTPYMDVKAIADGVLKDSQLIPELQQRIDLVDGADNLPGSVNQRLKDAKTEILNSQSSVSDSVSALSTRVDGVSAKIDQTTALVTTEETARTNADGALGQRLDVVAAGVASNTAAITTEQTTRAAGDSANATLISTLQTTVGGHTTSLQTQANSINGLSAQYTVKIDNNGYVSGYGLASYPVNGQIVSEFAVRTDTFSVNLPGYPGIHPFTIGSVYGQPRVIISSALIGDASIDNAKIGDAQITSAKIGNAQIGTAHIGYAQIDTLRIGPNAVSTLVQWGVYHGNSVYYQSTGGVLTVFISTDLGWISTQGDVTPATMSVRMNGAEILNATNYGPYTGFTLQQPAAGIIQFTFLNPNDANPSSPKHGLLLVFEAKR